MANDRGDRSPDHKIDARRVSARVLLAQGNSAIERHDGAAARSYYEAARATDPTFISPQVALCLLPDGERPEKRLGEVRELIQRSDSRVAHAWKPIKFHWEVNWYRVVHAQAGAALNRVSEITDRTWLHVVLDEDVELTEAPDRLGALARSLGTQEQLNRALDDANKHVKDLLDAAKDVGTPFLKPRYPRFFISRRRRRSLERRALAEFVSGEVLPAAKVLAEGCRLVGQQVRALEATKSSETITQHEIDDWKKATTPDASFEKSTGGESYRVCYNHACLWSSAAIPIDEHDANNNAGISLAWLTRAVERADGYAAKWLRTYAPQDPSLGPLRSLRGSAVKKLLTPPPDPLGETHVAGAADE